MKGSRGGRSLGIDWYLPGAKRRFATTPVATSHLLTEVARDGGTWQEVHDAILYDAEAKAVCAAFVANGYGGTEARTMLAVR